MTLFKKKYERERSKTRQPRLMQGQDDISFRRSRTLTGSKSSEVKAVNERKAELKSDRISRLEMKRQRRVILTGLVVLFIIIAGIYYLISQYISEVRNISFEPTNATLQDKTVYKNEIMNYFRQRPSERFRFAVNSEQLSQSIAKRFPEVAKAEASGGEPGDFVITLRKPIAGWKVGERQYFVDETGEAFENNYFNTPSVDVIDKSGAKIGDGDAVASGRFLRFLGRLVAITNSSGLGTVTEASLPVNTTREIDIKLSGRGFFVKTNTDRDPAATVEDMRRVVNYLDQRQLAPTYIDLRVEGRAFYR